MIKHKFTKVITLLVMMVMIIGSQLVPNAQFVQAKNQSNDVYQVLQGLSKEQRAALKQLNAEPGFTIEPGINVESDAPVNVIIEFTQDPAALEVAKSELNPKRATAATLEEAEKKVKASHKAFKEELSRLAMTTSDTPIEVTQEYENALNGVAMTLPGTALRELMQSGLIKRVWKNEEIQGEKPITDQITPKMMDSVPQIGVDRLHDEEITGKSIKVGVLDTGIDYNHPDLTKVYKGYRSEDGDASNMQPNDVKGWDFIDDDADPMETTYQEWKASGNPEFDMVGNSYYTAHGTHVSGTIAGQQDHAVDYSVKGVAPDVELYGYRVLGPYGSGGLDGIIAAMEKSITDEMDVINLSLGAPINDPVNPLSIAANNTMLAGVVAVISAGNSGPAANTLGTPGAAAFPITVGASDVSITLPTFTATAGKTTLNEVQLFAKGFNDELASLEGQAYEVVAVGLGSAEDFAAVDVENKIVLIERGELAFDEKIKNAKQAKAVAAIIYNNEDGQISNYLGEGKDYLPTFRLSKADGNKLKLALAKESSLTFGTLRDEKTVGDQLADFSSRGPVAGTYEIKPDLLAPGVAVYSTVPSYINDPEGETYDVAYGRMSGTSMAAPHIAGVAALILQENPAYTPFEVKTALMNTSVSLTEDYSIFEAGAGRVDAYNAVHAETSATVLGETTVVENNELVTVENKTGSLSFGSHYLSADSNIDETQKVVLENASDEKKTYTLKTAYLEARDNRQDAVANGVTLSVPKSITVNANDSAELNAILKVPSDVAFGTYEGYVEIQNGEEELRIPFAVRISDKGFDMVEFDRRAVPNKWEFHPFLNPLLSMDLRLKSPMETVYLIVKDSKTKEPIGIIGALDDLDGDVQYFVADAFRGSVFPFTDDPENPVSEEMLILPEGPYTYELIGTDKDGKTYTQEEFLVIDNTPAEITYSDYKPGVVEVDESMFTNQYGHYAFWVHTNIYDSTIDLLNDNGFEYDQSENVVAYYDNFPFPGVFGVEPDGTMKFGVLPEDIQDGSLNLELIPVDMATNADLDALNRFTFVQKGSLYSAPVYDKEQLKLNEEVTMTVDINNAKELTAGKFGIQYDEKRFKFKEVKLSEEFERFVKENQLEVSIDEPTIEKDDYGEVVRILAEIESADVFEGYTGSTNFLDVTFELYDDAHYGMSSLLTVKDFQYEQSGETNWQKVPVYYHDQFEILPSTSIVYGFIAPEAWLHESGFLPVNDYEALGVKVFATAKDGKVYPGTIDQIGQYKIQNLPVSKDAYTFTIQAPGHLTTMFTLNPAYEKDGVWVGDNVRAYNDMNAAGDVNQDGVIDIHDLMRLVAVYGKTGQPAMDINQDGVVDEADVRFIEKNFLKVGADAKGKKPTEKLGPKGLNDFLKSIGLEPKN